MRKAGQLANRVQVEALVTPGPGTTHRVVLFEDDGVDPAMPKCRGRRQPGRAAADDDYVGIRQGILT